MIQTVDLNYIKRVQAAHAQYGIEIKYKRRGNKQYITVAYKYRVMLSMVISSTGTVTSSINSVIDERKLMDSHLKQLFPAAYCTSSGYKGGVLHKTFRINP